ncbi:hypothetical protein EDD22DRAFT_853832 [Suillus occidentalis]|nr:hypothetical protein EDD22DRAFT_853832 [Suillus occidentalis]
MDEQLWESVGSDPRVRNHSEMGALLLILRYDTLGLMQDLMSYVWQEPGSQPGNIGKKQQDVFAAAPQWHWVMTRPPEGLLMQGLFLRLLSILKTMVKPDLHEAIKFPSDDVGLVSEVIEPSEHNGVPLPPPSPPYVAVTQFDPNPVVWGPVLGFFNRRNRLGMVPEHPEVILGVIWWVGQNTSISTISP